MGPDGYTDLTLKFDQQEIVAQIGLVGSQSDKLFTVTGKLKEEYGSTPFIGEDVVRIKVNKSARGKRRGGDFQREARFWD